MSFYLSFFYIYIFVLINNLCAEDEKTISFHLEVNYECLTPDCDGHYVITSPMTVMVDGIIPLITMECEPNLHSGYGKGIHFTVFLYHMILRFNAQPAASHVSEVFIPPPEHSSRLRRTRWIENERGIIWRNGRWVYVSKPPRRDPILGQQFNISVVPLEFLSKGANPFQFPYSKEHLVNHCSVDASIDDCPEFCFDCFNSRMSLNQIHSWKNSDGSTCYLPNFINGNKISHPEGGFPPWIWSYKYLYLSNAEHFGNPCYLPTDDYPDVNKLQCKKPPPPPKPCPPQCTPQNGMCLCPP